MPEYKAGAPILRYSVPFHGEGLPVRPSFQLSCAALYPLRTGLIRVGLETWRTSIETITVTKLISAANVEIFAVLAFVRRLRFGRLWFRHTNLRQPYSLAYILASRASSNSHCILRRSYTAEARYVFVTPAQRGVVLVICASHLALKPYCSRVAPRVLSLCSAHDTQPIGLCNPYIRYNNRRMERLDIDECSSSYLFSFLVSK